jgi:uncharacterized membrane protein YhfC
MFASRNIALHAELLKEAEEKVALSPLAAGIGGAVGAGVPTALLMRHLAKRNEDKTRNVAFGAGMATGVATPFLLRRLLDIAKTRGIIAPGSEGMA